MSPLIPITISYKIYVCRYANQTALNVYLFVPIGWYNSNNIVIFYISLPLTPITIQQLKAYRFPNRIGQAASQN